MKAVIIDDDKKATLDLSQRLAMYPFIELEGTASNGFNGLELVVSSKPDVLFLDVELPDISGIEFLERSEYLRNSNCRVIIYTSYDKYILPAFRNQAFDVLIKPIDTHDFEAVMDRLSKDDNTPRKPNYSLAHNDNRYMLYTNSVDFTLVNKRDICLFLYDSAARCWEAVVAGVKQPIKLRRSIKSEDLMNLDKIFVQVNQRYIINMNCLVEVVDNKCHFFPPFEHIDYVTVGRVYLKKLRQNFFNL